MKKIDDNNYLSDEGKVFSHITSNEIMGYGICLGDNDSIDNYTEIDLPEEFKGNEDYDNTITITIDMINDHKTSLKYNIKNEN